MKDLGPKRFSTHITMVEGITEQVAKLQLDEKTGEMVFKNELKKRTQKRTKKVAAASRNVMSASESEFTAAKQEPAGKPPKPEESKIDPDAMFKQGFLADVYKLRPAKNVVTWFPPEPNGYLHVNLSDYAARLSF